MIEDPPVLKIRRNFTRPTKDQIDALSGTPTSFLVDAMDGRGALGPDVCPADPDNSVFCGAALTCHTGPADVLAVLAALSEAKPGDVIIAAADGYRETATIGDRVAGMAHNKGVVAFVTDGCARDLAGIVESGLPCFHDGVTPNSPAASGPGTVGLPITLSGVSVNAGDIVVGDADGVVIIPLAMADTVIERLVAIREMESTLDARVRDGLTEFDHIPPLLAGDRVKIVD